MRILTSRRGTSDTSDRRLLDRCAAGDARAIDLLVDRYVVPGLATAIRISGDHAPAERLLDAVHDAFITAVDEALDGNADGLAPVFNQLLAEFASALSAAPGDWTDPHEPTVTPADMRQLRRDVVSEVGLTVDLRLEPPRRSSRGHALVRGLRNVRRRLALSLPAATSMGELRIVVR